jgi:uncharacterized protein (DUF952 family)
VLEPGGRFYVAVVHPINSSGHFDQPEKPATFSFGAPYLAERFNDDEVEQDGLTMRFVSLHRPLDRYSRCLEGAGFVIETMRELTEPDPASRWYDVPLFLHLVAVKPPLTARLDRRIFHITTGSEADRLMAEGALEPPSLAAEGFVHCSTAAQVVDTTARYYAPEAELVLLELDPELVESDIAWPEVYPGPGPGLGQRFPHVHGPLTRAAVRRRHPWGPGDRQQWLISESG